MTPRVSGQMIARNTLLNIAGQAAPAAAALLTIPYVVRGLGVDRFGVLSIVYSLITYLTIFDFGLGRATTRFVARALADRDDSAIPEVVWTAAAVQVGIGATVGVLLAGISPSLVGSVIRVPVELRVETVQTFQLVALIVPLLVCVVSFRGVLEAYQRFGLVNIVRSISGTALFGMPALAVLVGFHLRGVMVLLDGALVLTSLAYVAMDLVVSVPLRRRPRLSLTWLPALMKFGGWVTVCGLLIPFLVSSDRFFLAAVSGVATVTYYVVPYELAARFQVIPSSLGSVLFPVFTTLGTRDAERTLLVLARSTRYLLMAMGIVAFALLTWGRTGLLFWLGPSFGSHAHTILAVIAIGMLINSLSQVPAHLIDGLGRPDLRARIFVGELPVYFGLLYLLVGRFGAIGAAIAWAVRACAELVLFYGVGLHLARGKLSAILRATFPRPGGVLTGFSAAGFGIASITRPAGPVFYSAAGALTIVFGIVGWFMVLEEREQAVARDLLTRLLARRL